MLAHKLLGDGAVGAVVGAEIVDSADRADHRDSLVHSIAGENSAFDLAELDTQTSELDLIVASAQDDNVAVVCPARVVARPVDSLAVVKPEALFGQLWIIEIAVGNTRAANIQLADNTRGQRISVRVNDILPDIQQRSAYANLVCVCQLLGVAGNGDFRRAVCIEDTRLGDFFQVLEQLWRILFAAAHDYSALREHRLECVEQHILLNARRRSIYHVATRALKQCAELHRVLGFVLVGEYERQTVAQRRGGFLKRHIEGHGGYRNIDASFVLQRVYMRVFGERSEVIRDARVSDDNALRSARGA